MVEVISTVINTIDDAETVDEAQRILEECVHN
jgi:hypothetical protein